MDWVLVHSLLQVVTTQTALLRLEPPDHIRLALLDFVSSLGRLSISKDTQDKVLPSLASTLDLLLADGTWLLEQHALEAFTKFAEGTSHEEIVPQCLSSEAVKNKIVSFLEKTELVKETADARVARVKREKCIFRGPLVGITAGAAESPLEPPAKRACTAGPLEAALQAAEGALDTLEELLAMGPAPGWLPAQLRVLLRRIEMLNRLSEDPHDPQRNHGGPTSSTEETSLGSGL